MTTTEPQEGLLVREGTATTSGSWVGQEVLLLRGDLGLGEVACEVAYEVVSVASVEDCEVCLVAYQVRLGVPKVLVNTQCAAAELDAATIAALESEERFYGVALNYLGHADVMMVQEDGAWSPGPYINWEEETATVTYSWDQGYWLW